jgi:hypothetical protein
MTRPDSPQWIAAKAEGDRAELAIATWFKGRGFSALKTLGDAPFDLLLEAEVEVKRDRKAATTGNVAIEVRDHGQPSDILTSRTIYWAIALDGEAVIVKTDALPDFMLTGKFREVAAAEHLASTVRLAPVAKLKALKGAQVIELPEVATMKA